MTHMVTVAKLRLDIPQKWGAGIDRWNSDGVGPVEMVICQRLLEALARAMRRAVWQAFIGAPLGACMGI